MSESFIILLCFFDLYPVLGLDVLLFPPVHRCTKSFHVLDYPPLRLHVEIPEIGPIRSYFHHVPLGTRGVEGKWWLQFQGINQPNPFHLPQFHVARCLALRREPVPVNDGRWNGLG